MENNICPQCGAPIDSDSVECKFCGKKLIVNQKPVQQAQQIVYVQQPVVQSNIDSSWPVKSKTTAGILGIFLGGLGIHKFYLGNIKMGIVYLLFCWTYVPEIIGFIEGIIYLNQDDEMFMQKNHVRVKGK